MRCYRVEVPGQRWTMVDRWSQAIELARLSGWTASVTQFRFADDGYELERIEIEPHHIEQDYRERAQ